jgi:group I intron endonuclease
MEKIAKLGKIYKLVNSENDKIYVGSTGLQYLSKRLGHHRLRCLKCPTSGKLYPAMNTIGMDKFRIILLESMPFTNKEELRAKEYEWIEKLDCIRSGYNTISKDGEVTDEMKRKISKGKVQYFKRINGNNKLTGINYNEDNGCPKWKATWMALDTKTQKSKSFSVLKYGYNEAKQMAIDYRNEMIWDLEQYN